LAATGAPAEAPVTTRRPTTRRQMVGIVIAVVSTVILFQIGSCALRRSGVEPTHLVEISPRELTQAREAWSSKGPKSYNLEFVFEAPANTSNMRLEVRNGVAKTLVKNGTQVTRADELVQWTMEGQFDQIAHYIQTDTSPAAKNAGRSMRNVGRFDEKLGYPAEYSRQGNGDQVKYHITVTKFEEVTQ
jgi:hypothetical protein